MCLLNTFKMRCRMTNEEQAKLEAEQKAKADAEAQDAEFNASLEGLSDEEKAQKIAEREKIKGSNIENNIDYKAIAEKERIAREKAEKTAADLAFKLREDKRKKEEAGEIVDDKLTKADLQAVLDEQNQRFEKLLNADKTSEIAKRIATSSEEAEAIIETYKNRQFPANLSLEEKLSEAQAIVNAPKLKAINQELVRSVNSKSGVNTNPSAPQQDTLPTGESKLTPDVKAELKRQGFSFNATTHRFEKKANNRTLIYDEKAGKTLAL